MNMDLKLNIQSPNFKGLMSREQCLELANKVMQLYDSDKNNLMEVNDAGNLQNDCYKAINIQYTPSQTDISGYAKIFNSNYGTGKISKGDIERLCFKYFGGYTTEPVIETQQKQQETIDLSPIQNNEQVPTSSKYQYQSPYKRYASQKSTQGSQSSIQSNKQIAVKSQVVEVTQKKEQPKYSRMAEARLQVARRIFKMLDQECNGYITEKHVTPLLIETYKDLGMTIEPTSEDVEMWMEMTDLDRDGKVYLTDYEAFVLMSLKKQGIQID